jgi:large-conductance mechanosensitive channel
MMIAFVVIAFVVGFLGVMFVMNKVSRNDKDNQE